MAGVIGVYGRAIEKAGKIQNGVTHIFIYIKYESMCNVYVFLSAFH